MDGELGRPAAYRLDGECFEATTGRPWKVHDLVPREATGQPAGGGNDCGLTHRVVHRLPGVVLTVELCEQAEGRPRQVELRHEPTIGPPDFVLTNGLTQPWD